MLKPTKHMNLNLSVLKVSSEILLEIKKKGMLRYDEVLSKLVDSFGEDVKEIFIPSISFLYLLDKINYDLKTDSFILNETQ